MTARSREASIVISRSTTPIAISAKVSSRSTALVLANGADCNLDVRTAPIGYASPSLSLSLRNSFEVKIGTEIHFRSQSLFFLSTKINFQKILFSGPTKHPHFQKSIFGNDFYPKQIQPKSLPKEWYTDFGSFASLLLIKCSQTFPCMLSFSLNQRVDFVCFRRQAHK